MLGLKIGCFDNRIQLRRKPDGNAFGVVIGIGIGTEFWQPL